MKIAWSGRHTPYAYMFITAFPEIQFVVDEWGEIFRPMPKNAVVGPMAGEFDVVITDYWDFSTTRKAKAKRTVFLDHCEYGQPIEVAQAVLEKVDAFVCVSEHKLWTHRELAFDPKMHWVWFCFDGEMWPEAQGEKTDTVGFLHNMVRGEQIDIANNLFDGLDGLAVGHNNEAFKGRLVSPWGLQSTIMVASRLSVAVNIVNGDSCGMSPLELMTMGVPVIFGLSADNPRFLFSGFNCLITNGRIGDCIPEARLMLTELLRDPARREYIGKNARRSVLREMSMEKFRREWLKVLEAGFMMEYPKQEYVYKYVPALEVLQSPPSQDNPPS